ncbi:MAG: ABC transporter substrate-binding protein, partial [Ignavibacteriales bacterium]|nr:ABC transporter substrate-binding protein [Ignavibacteriales bacterium]
MKKLYSMMIEFYLLSAIMVHVWAQKPTWTIGMSQCNLGEPWRVQMNADVKNAAEAHPGLKVIF